MNNLSPVNNLYPIRNTVPETEFHPRSAISAKNKLSFKDGAKSTANTVLTDTAVNFCLEIIEKRNNGKKICDFDENDWLNIGKSSANGLGKGSLKGVSIYMLSRYTATPSAVADSLINASLNVAEQARLYHTGTLDQLSFIENSESLCIESAVDILSCIIGQAVIPIPVVSAVIGTAVGTVVYEIGKNYLSEKEHFLVESYLHSIRKTNAQLHKQYQQFVSDISHQIQQFLSILNGAFSSDIHTALTGSVALAKEIGVPYEDILDTDEKMTAFFTD